MVYLLQVSKVGLSPFTSIKVPLKMIENFFYGWKLGLDLLFFKKALHEVNASGIQLSFNIF